MGKQYGNTDVNAPRDGEDHPQTSPSTHDRSKDSGGAYTSSFPADKITHKHHSVKGEDDQAGQAQYRARDDIGKHSKGPALDRAVPRQGPYGDRAERFGTIGSGVPGKTSGNPYANSGNRSFTDESFSDDDSFARRHGSGGLGKSG